MTTKLISALRNRFGRPQEAESSTQPVSEPDYRGTGSADKLTEPNDDPSRDQDTASPEAALESGAARIDPDSGEAVLADSEIQRHGAEGQHELDPQSETGRLGAEEYPDEGYPDGGFPDERSKA